MLAGVNIYFFFSKFVTHVQVLNWKLAYNWNEVISYVPRYMGVLFFVSKSN